MTSEHEFERGAQREPVPPVGEELHIPGPSILPILLAAGITLALIGITISIVLVIIGLALAIPVAVIWLRTTLADIGELPPSHHH